MCSFKVSRSRMRTLMWLGTLSLVQGCGQREYSDMSDTDLAARLTSYLDGVMESRPMPGLAVAVVTDGALIYTQGFGVRRLGGESAVTPATVFHTASVSKAFVAIAALRLADEGKLDLDSPVTRYLPYFRLADGREGEITARGILSHTTGLPDVEDYGWDTPEFDEMALERYVRGLGEKRLLFEPGTRWSYSNLAYEVLGDALAKIEGLPFEQVMDMQVLGPLQMEQSGFLPIPEATADRATPHRGALAPAVSDIYPYHRAHAPSSTLHSNARDLARFAAAILVPQASIGEEILADSSRESMWEPQADVGDGIRMGLGWFLRSHRGARMVLAPGRDPGFNALVALLPDHGVGVVLLSNYDGQSAFELVEIADGVLDVGLGRKPALPKVSIAVPVGRVVSREGIDAAIAEYRRLRAAGDSRYEFGISDLITLGHDLRATGRTEDAIRLYQLNAQEHPGYFASHSALATAYLALGDTVRAVDSYRKVLAMDPERYGCPESCYRDERLDALLAER